MRIEDCWRGKVVARKRDDNTLDYGHVIGITLNCTNEPIVEVDWADPKGYSPIHPSNILDPKVDL